MAYVLRVEKRPIFSEELMSKENRIGQPGVMKTHHHNGMTGGFIAKLIFSVFYNLVFFGGMLFL